MLGIGMRSILIVGVLVAGGVYLGAPAHAESCAAHLAKHGTTEAVDIQYHLVNGGASPCKVEQDYREATQRAEQQPKQQQQQQSSNSGSYESDRKSRHCRKNWYC
jgi:hypothetical protein